MWKVVVSLLGIAVLLSLVFMAHGIVTGIVVPYPDPTPDQAIYERRHREISNILFLASGVAWLAMTCVGAVGTGRWVIRMSTAKR
jgi:hypothetical protein